MTGFYSYRTSPSRVLPIVLALLDIDLAQSTKKLWIQKIEPLLLSAPQQPTEITAFESKFFGLNTSIYGRSYDHHDLYGMIVVLKNIICLILTILDVRREGGWLTKMFLCYKKP